MIPKEVHNTFYDRLSCWWEPNGGFKRLGLTPKDELIKVLRRDGYSEEEIERTMSNYGKTVGEVLGDVFH